MATTTASDRSRKDNATDDNDAKPITGYAPPPVAALLSMITFSGLALYFFPTSTVVQPDIFVHRVFPAVISVEVLLYVRGAFALICFWGFASAWLTPPATCNTPYRVQSKIPRLPFVLKGWGKQYPFTSWSWNLLGVSFAVSAYVGYQVHHHQDGDDGDAVQPWLARLALILWEVAAPMTLLVGAVVKYALWPAQIKQTGRGDNFLTPRALLQHNANVIMAVTEVALLGGLPVHFEDISISVLYGCSYVFFTWTIMMTWHGRGPAFLYFFMDTTLGNEHTMALYVLLSVLMAFYGLFAGIETALSILSSSLLGHVGFAIVLCSSVCRFRD